MDFYLTNLRTGSRLRFPLLPDRLSVKTGASTQTFTIIKIGEVKAPRGTTVTGYSWNGTLPGPGMQELSCVFDWQEPSKIIALLEEWMSKGDILRFMVTETGVNMDVFIETFVYDYYGPGNVSFTLSLAQFIPLSITTVQGEPPPPTKHPRRPTISISSAAESSGGGSSGGSGSGGSSGGTTKTTSPGSGSYRVRPGDSLFSIAKAQLGDGGRWLEIFNMNKSTIDGANKGKGVSQYTLQTGIYLKLPAKRANPSASVYNVFSNTVKSAVNTAATAVKNFVSSPPGKLIVNVATTAFNTLKAIGSKATVNNPPPAKKASKSSVIRSEKRFYHTDR